MWERTADDTVCTAVIVARSTAHSTLVGSRPATKNPARSKWTEPVVFYVQLKLVVEVERLVRKWFLALGALKASEMVLMLFEECDLFRIVERRLAFPTAVASCTKAMFGNR